MVQKLFQNLSYCVLIDIAIGCLLRSFLLVTWRNLSGYKHDIISKSKPNTHFPLRC